MDVLDILEALLPFIPYMRKNGVSLFNYRWIYEILEPKGLGMEKPHRKGYYGINIEIAGLAGWHTSSYDK